MAGATSTASLLAKYRKKLLRPMPAASVICSIVVLATPWLTKRSSDASMSAGTRCLVGDPPGSLPVRFVAGHRARVYGSGRLAVRLGPPAWAAQPGRAAAVGRAPEPVRLRR